MLNPKLRPSFFCTSSCCTETEGDNHNHNNDGGYQKVLRLSDDDNNKHRHHHHNNLHVSIATWLKSEIPEIKVRCSGIFSGRSGKNRRNSSEFRYDPLSYALNFEDDHARFDELPPRNFSARLAPSKVERKMSNNNVDIDVVVSTQIAAWS
ncbi:hypothetical protein vseg_002519 [Gypsophila vaccaria]